MGYTVKPVVVWGLNPHDDDESRELAWEIWDSLNDPNNKFWTLTPLEPNYEDYGPLTYAEFQRVLETWEEEDGEIDLTNFKSPTAFEDPCFDMDTNPIERVFIGYDYGSDIEFGPFSDETDSRIQGYSPLDRGYTFGVYAMRWQKNDSTFKMLNGTQKAEDLPFYADLLDRLEALAPRFVQKRRDAGQPIIEKELFTAVL